jgi:hypothetical protein
MRKKAMSGPVKITIKPSTPIGGPKEIECDVSGPADYVADNAIFLPSNTEGYEIEFKLVSNDYSWDDDPFWCKQGKCPTGPTSGKIKYTGKNGSDTITVSSEGTNGKALSHYRMNFKDGYYCDPIIINT